MDGRASNTQHDSSRLNGRGFATHQRREGVETDVPGGSAGRARIGGPGQATRLPLQRVRTALDGHHVVSVIVAHGGRPWREHLLAVTSAGLAILTPRTKRHCDEHEFTVSLVRWPLVRLGGLGETLAEDDGSWFGLVVRVGRRSFVSLLDGPSGQRTLRDFVVAVQKGMRGEYAYLDYDAASMLTF